jgi:hypothetical protein
VLRQTSAIIQAPAVKLLRLKAKALATKSSAMMPDSVEHWKNKVNTPPEHIIAATLYEVTSSTDTLALTQTQGGLAEEHV